MDRLNKKHYVPDLTTISSICEANYARLLKLLPNMNDDIGREFTLSGGPQHSTKIRFSIEEHFKYTLTILVEQTNELADFLKPPRMEVRLYQDVRMAEVISFDNNHRFNGVYTYPNAKMHQPDEKHQINLFFSDWLSHCLEHGEANIQLNFLPEPLKCDSSTRTD
ncbi:MAG: hypothetical protein ACI843_001082 [Psychrobacter glaciei]|jgi:uncharacterized protein YqiB (DUF1249 family)